MADEYIGICMADISEMGRRSHEAKTVSRNTIHQICRQHSPLKYYAMTHLMHARTNTFTRMHRIVHASKNANGCTHPHVDACMRLESVSVLCGYRHMHLACGYDMHVWSSK